MITLSAPATLTNPNNARRYKLQLVSVEQELDSNEVPVPVASEIVDVCVVEPIDRAKEAISMLLSTRGYLEGYQVMSFWVPEDCDCF